MVRYDCKFCGENVFDVVDIEHLDTLPRTWVCSGCGREYNGELDEEGNLIVYQKGYKRSALVYEEPALIEPASGFEGTPEPEDVSAPGPEELIEPEKPEGEESVNEDTLPEVGAETERPEGEE